MALNKQLILNRYRPIEEAGSGGFGTVQVAWDTRIQRKVAIKIIELDEFEAAKAAATPADAQPASGAAEAPVDPAAPTAALDDAAAAASAATPADADADADEAFEHTMAHVPGLDEARTAAMLSDASIVAVYDFEVQGTTAYLIMEYVEGITLSQLLRNFDDRMDLDIIAAVFSSVAQALTVAHENQVLHLDIKPDNILINRQGQVKVTDFGLATLVDASGHGRAGGGTIGYMPLEQMRQEPLDERCDEWALASVAYTMIAGKNPFLAPDLAQAEAAIEDAELVLPSLCWDDLDEAADDVIFYALDPDREERYDSVAEFAEELEPLLGDPKKGAKELAGIVGDAQLEEEESGEPARKRQRVPLRDRITRRKRSVGAHLLGALGSAALAAFAAMNISLIGGYEDPVFWGVVGVVAVLGGIWPHIGALVGYLALSIALILQESIVLGVVLIVVTVLWWFFVARKGKAAANTALVCQLAGAFGLGQLAPLAAGFCLGPAYAAATSGYCALIAAILAACGSDSLLGWNALVNWNFASAGAIELSLLELLQRPETWIIVASWILAALALALFRKRPTRPFAVFGTLLAAVVLFAGLALSAWVVSGQTAWTPSVADVVCTAIPVVVMLVACVILPEPDRDD